MNSGEQILSKLFPFFFILCIHDDEQKLAQINKKSTLTNKIFKYGFFASFARQQDNILVHN